MTKPLNPLEKKVLAKKAKRKRPVARKKKPTRKNLNTIQRDADNSIIVHIDFIESLGNLRATQSRNGKTIAQGKLTAVGSGDIILEPGESGDVIGITGETEGKDADLSILNARVSPEPDKQNHSVGKSLFH